MAAVAADPVRGPHSSYHPTNNCFTRSHTPATGTGTSATCTDAVKAKGTVCQASDSPCNLDAKCDGAAKTCPARKNVANGTPCKVRHLESCVLPTPWGACTECLCGQGRTRQCTCATGRGVRRRRRRRRVTCNCIATRSLPCDCVHARRTLAVQMTACTARHMLRMARWPCSPLCPQRSPRSTAGPPATAALREPAPLSSSSGG